MLKIKDYFMYGLLFNCVVVFSIMSMNRDLQTASLDGVVIPLVDLHNLGGSTMLENTSNVASKSAQCIEERKSAEENKSYNVIRDHIDENILGIVKDSWFRGIRGALYSYYKNKFLSPEQAVKEMNSIDSYVVGENKEHIIEQLEKKHWYVNYLLQASVHAKMKEICGVTGSTIDDLYNPTAEEGFKTVVHKRALKGYFLRAGIKRSLFDGVPMGLLGDIHWIVLYGHAQQIYRNSLAMSSDGKYLRSIDIEKNEKVWDMEQGLATDRSAADIQWIHGFYPDMSRYCVLDKTDTYFAETFSILVSTGENGPPMRVWDIGQSSNIPVVIEKNEPAIMLFKRPQEISYLCQTAFYNSQGKREELIALRDSKSMSDIQGFPQKNLQNVIKKNIDSMQARL